MVSDKSILLRLHEQGQPAARVDLRGTERNKDARTRYELVGELARGGVGVVHRGRDNDLGRDVALKVLREEYLANPELVRRFVEEAQIGAQLQHPGIVPVYELGLLENQRPYFAMKLVKGETLAARLQRRTDPGDGRRTMLAIFRDACRTVAYAHARGVIHRDLKPANIMIGSFGEVQVVDWGFAKVLRAGGIDDERLAKAAKRLSTMIATVRSGDDSNPSLAGSVMGTPAYMPPEQALGHVEELDARSDVFSLGAILCEILTGAPPFTGIGEASMCDLDGADASLDRCGADKSLVDLCRRALAPLPKDRPADAQVIANAIADYLGKAEGRAHRMQVHAAQSQARAEKQQRARRFTLMLSVGGVAAMILIGLTFLWIHNKGVEHDRREQKKIATAVREAQNEPDDRKALVAAKRARRDGGDVDDLIAELDKRIHDREATQTRDKLARDLLAALEEAGSKHGDREFTSKQIDAEYEAALELHDVELETLSKRLEGAPHRKGIAGALQHWAYQRRRRKQFAESIHRTAQSLDPSIGDLDETVTTPDKIDGIAPTRLAIMAWTLNSQEKTKQAEALLRAAQRKHPDHFWVNTALGTTLTERREKPLEAARYFAAARGLRPESIEAIHRLGKALEKGERQAEALETFRTGVRLNPTWAHGYMHIGEILRKAGKLDDALKALRAGLKLKPDNEPLNLSMCYTLRSSGKAEEARRFLRLTMKRSLQLSRQGLEKDPENPERLSGYLSLLMLVERFEDAEPIARRLIRVRLAPVRAWHSLAIVLQALGRDEDSQSAQKRCDELVTKLKIDPVKARLMKARTLIARGDLAGAENTLRGLIARDGKNRVAWWILARVLHKQGNHRDADAAQEKSADLARRGTRAPRDR